MSSKTNDARSFWTVWIALVALFVIIACVARAQSPYNAGNKCTMRLLSKPQPQYPVLKKKHTLKAGVVVNLLVNEDGTVERATLGRSCGIKEYDDAVVTAVRKWRYNKAVGCGERRSTVTVQIHPN